MLDGIFKHLYKRKSHEEWTSLNELSEIMEKGGLGPEEADGVLSFLRSYFLEVDEVKQRARLSRWAYSFVEVTE
ncbi:MAG: hypothetical protein OEZ24_00745 [Candidatus Bathyarchaeota archaeon]|nr:hypothetical protein [Candidatus Bathyarchaeota archaeon]